MIATDTPKITDVLGRSSTSQDNEISRLLQNQATASTKPKDDLGKDEFLHLLITSLRYQDPLSPASNEQFLAQMAEFSALENSKNMMRSMDRLVENFDRMIDQQTASSSSMTQASSTALLGKEVRARIDEIQYQGTPIKFKVDIEEAGGALITIVDENNKAINTLPIPTAGEMEVTWDGTLPDGSNAQAGTYQIVVTNTLGTKPNGYAYEEGKVTGISYGLGGSVVLEVGNKKLDFADLVYVKESKSNS